MSVRPGRADAPEAEPGGGANGDWVRAGIDGRFLRTQDDKRAGARFPLVRAFCCAASGVAMALGERNMRIDLVFAAAAVALGIVLGIDAASWCAVIVCIALVLALECVNTAIEAMVDLASPGYHELAKRAKDCAAGAALIAAAGSVAVAFAVYVPRILALAAG